MERNYKIHERDVLLRLHDELGNLPQARGKPWLDDL